MTDNGMERNKEAEWRDGELEKSVEYRCRICRQTLSSAADLKAQFQRGDGRGRFRYDSCPYQSDRRADVQRHSDGKHRKSEPTDRRHDRGKDCDREPPKVQRLKSD